MRTGAIFERAMKCIGLVGVVFALGAGQAVAQPTPTASYGMSGILIENLGDLSTEAARGRAHQVSEGGVNTIRVSMEGTIAAAASGSAGEVTVTAVIAPSTTTALAPEADDILLGPNVTGTAPALTSTVTLPYPAPDADDVLQWARSASINLTAGLDPDAENEEFTITFTVTGVSGTAPGPFQKLVRIKDAQTQTYVLEPKASDSLREGGDTLEVTLKAEPPHVDYSRNLLVHVDNPLYELQVESSTPGTFEPLGTLSIGAGAGTGGALDNDKSFRVKSPSNDANRVEDTVTLTAVSLAASDPNRGGKTEDTLPVPVADIHVLPMITAMITDKDGMVLDPQPDSVMEGEDIYLTLTAERPKPAIGEVAPATEEVTVKLMPTGSADASDFRFESPHPVKIPKAPNFGDKSTSVEKFKIAILDDPDVADEMLVFDAVANGAASRGAGTSTNPAILSLAIVDQTGSNVSPKSDADVMAAYMAAREEAAGDDELWTAAGEPDPAIMLDLEDLFDLPMSGFNVSADAMSSDDMVVMADANSGMVTLTPKGDGEAMITVTATTTASSSVGTQVSANIATVELMVMVDKLPPVITVMTDPMGMVEEGGTITVTATLNQMAPYDKEIMLTVVGPVEGEDHSIMIEEGEMMGQAMLMVMDDDEVKPLSDIVIVATHAAIEGGTVEMMLSVTENDSVTTYELSGPEDMNLVEGEEYEIMATASAAVMEDTEVMLMRDRAASDAGDDDYTVESIMIMAGETMGTTMLMVTADDMPDGGTGTNMGEKLVLFGMVGNVQTNDLSFYLWDAAVPALPIIAQLLLAAFLAIGGYHRYLRR